MSLSSASCTPGTTCGAPGPELPDPDGVTGFGVLRVCEPFAVARDDDGMHVPGGSDRRNLHLRERIDFVLRRRFVVRLVNFVVVDRTGDEQCDRQSHDRWKRTKSGLDVPSLIVAAAVVILIVVAVAAAPVIGMDRCESGRGAERYRVLACGQRLEQFLWRQFAKSSCRGARLERRVLGQSMR